MGRKRTTPEPTPEPTIDPEVDAYLETLPDRHREIAEAFRKLVRRIVPELVESMHWGLPVYATDDGKVCYLKSVRTHLQVGFWKGADLPDPESQLRGTGGRMRHVRLRRTQDVDSKPFRALLRAAARYVDPDG